VHSNRVGTEVTIRLRRLYRSIEDGIIELDDILGERTANLKSERDQAKATLDRARAQYGTVTAIDAVKIDAFAVGDQSRAKRTRVLCRQRTKRDSRALATLFMRFHHDLDVPVKTRKKAH
jgi:hypothetical protein